MKINDAVLVGNSPFPKRILSICEKYVIFQNSYGNPESVKRENVSEVVGRFKFSIFGWRFIGREV